MRTFKTVTTQELTTLVCDGCGLQASTDSDYEFQEFISVSHQCGYGSIHGDGKQIDIDLCQQCFADMCGDSLRVTEERNSIIEGDESSDMNPLEYSNIFDVICQSKAKALQLKSNCDLRIAARDILLKNKVADNNDLAVALKRVEQIWDSQYLSTESNELHQLADLICAYEKKDWNSFFKEAPLATDDFMAGRLSVKSKFTSDEKTASGLLSSLFINTSIGEDKQHLLESIANVQAKYPELRLGQLLINVLNLQQPCPELFHIKDKVLAEKLNRLLGL